MKRNKFAILLCLVFSTSTYAMDTDDIGFDEESDTPINTEYDQEIAALMQQTRAAECDIDTQTIVDTLATQANLPFLEQFNVYKFTNPPVIRSLHDLPSLRPWYGCTDKLCFYSTFFYNQMFHAYYTKCGTFASDYLFIDKDDAIIGAIENLVPTLGVADIIPLFNTARLQMRRLGAMFGVSKCFGNWRVNAAVPLYYLELNFFLTQKQVDALGVYFSGGQPVPVDADFGQNKGFTIFDSNTFVNKHVISDKVGFGDIRLYLDYMFAPESRYPTRFGGMLTLPNSTVMRKAIAGNSFSKCNPGPGIDFTLAADLVCQATLGSTSDPLTLSAQNALIALGQSYAVQFVDRLSATVLENSLGQKQVSYGFLAETFLGVTNCTNLCLFFEWDQFIKGNEDRPVKLVITPSESLGRDYTDPAQAQDNLTFLEQRADNILWPLITNVKVKQGDVFKFRIYSQTNWEFFQWDVGYDLWARTKEIIAVCNTCVVPNAQLDIKTAGRPSALQGKIFGHFNMQKYPEYYENFGWRIGFCAEATVNNYGIGKDWLFGVDFVADF